jgi:threonine/homoserine/homoserine lactone efflux protein
MLAFARRLREYPERHPWQNAVFGSILLIVTVLLFADLGHRSVVAGLVGAAVLLLTAAIGSRRVLGRWFSPPALRWITAFMGTVFMSIVSLFESFGVLR